VYSCFTREEKKFGFPESLRSCYVACPAPAAAEAVTRAALALGLRQCYGPFWPNILEGGTGVDGAALEVRAPLLDRRMVRTCFRLPTMPWCMDKQLDAAGPMGARPAGMKRSRGRKLHWQMDPMELWIKEKHWNPAPRGELCAFTE